MTALHDDAGLALLLAAFCVGVAFLLIAFVIEYVIRHADSHAERVRRTRAAMARDYEPKDAEWRKRISNAALLIQLNGWRGPEGRKYEGERR